MHERNRLSGRAINMLFGLGAAILALLAAEAILDAILQLFFHDHLPGLLRRAGSVYIPIFVALSLLLLAAHYYADAGAKRRNIILALSCTLALMAGLLWFAGPQATIDLLQHQSVQLATRWELAMLPFFVLIMAWAEQAGWSRFGTLPATEAVSWHAVGGLFAPSVPLLLLAILAEVPTTLLVVACLLPGLVMVLIFLLLGLAGKGRGDAKTYFWTLAAAWPLAVISMLCTLLLLSGLIHSVAIAATMTLAAGLMLIGTTPQGFNKLVAGGHRAFISSAELFLGLLGALLLAHFWHISGLHDLLLYLLQGGLFTACLLIILLALLILASRNFTPRTLVLLYGPLLLPLIATMGNHRITLSVALLQFLLLLNLFIRKKSQLAENKQITLFILCGAVVHAAILTLPLATQFLRAWMR